MKTLLILVLTACPLFAQNFPAMNPQEMQLKSQLQKYGPDLSAALQRCSPEVGVRLKSFIAAGELDWLPQPNEALKVIGKHGPAAAEYVMAYAKDLRDPANFKAFVSDPEPLIYGKTSLFHATHEIETIPNFRQDTAIAALVCLLIGIIVGFQVSRRLKKQPVGSST